MISTTTTTTLAIVWSMIIQVGKIVDVKLHGDFWFQIVWGLTEIIGLVQRYLNVIFAIDIIIIDVHRLGN
jgi:hypothetical protein